MSDLRTDFKDDVLNITTNEKRKYRMINNPDGTVSFEDVTDYVQQGDTFGAAEVNQITEKVNSCLTRQDVVDNYESTAEDLPFSANKGRELKEEINGYMFAIRTVNFTNGVGKTAIAAIKKDAMVVAIRHGYAEGGVNIAVTSAVCNNDGELTLSINSNVSTTIYVTAFFKNI